MAKRPKNSISWTQFLLCGLLLSCIFYRNQDFPAPTPSSPQSEEPQVKILIRKASNQNKIQMRVVGKYQIVDQMGLLLYEGEGIALSEVIGNEQSIQIGHVKIPQNWLKILPDMGTFIELQGTFYRGALTLSLLGGKIQSVLEIPLETYLLGVIGCEMSNSWPIACLEAQAVIARTYALYQYQRSNKSRNYHMEDGVASQVFEGLKTENEQVSAAVRNTHGQILSYAGKIFSSYFHSTCGGHTASATGVLETKDLLPLSGVSCSFCTASKYYTWTTSFVQDELILALESLGPVPTNSVASIAGLNKDASGRCQQINVLFDNGVSKTYKSNDFRRVLGYSKLRSVKFEVQVQDRHILFQGGGFGHGVGLCQMGAKGMADQGLNYQDIVHFYYPGATLERIW